MLVLFDSHCGWAGCLPFVCKEILNLHCLHDFRTMCTYYLSNIALQEDSPAFFSYSLVYYFTLIFVECPLSYKKKFIWHSLQNDHKFSTLVDTNYYSFLFFL